MAHGADVARQTLRVDGSGVKVCALSDGVDTLVARQTGGDLPFGIDIVPAQAGSGAEGTAVLEILHDLAPGASLGFATALGGPAQFATNIITLQQRGCGVIVDDIFYFNEPVFQDGIIAQAVDTVADRGVLYFSAAGNGGNLNDGSAGVWEGDFVSSEVAPPNFEDMDVHDFGNGTGVNRISRDSPFALALQWSDPWGQSANDYDLFVLDPTLTEVLGAATNIQDGVQDPLELLNSRNFNDLNNHIVVVRYRGARRHLHVNTMRGELAIATAGQTAGHAAAEGAFGVAAVDVALAGGERFDGSERVEQFSSDGPRRIFFEADGTPITPGNFLASGGTLRLKPDITAADGVSTSTPDFERFFGTSAAAPHAAAIAALMRSARPSRRAEIRAPRLRNGRRPIDNCTQPAALSARARRAR